MYLAVEGCDKAGKSTLHRDLIEALVEEYRRIERDCLPYVYKMGVKPQDINSRDVAYFQHKAILDFYDQNAGTLDIVLDRCYLSEMVYSGVKRDYDAMADERYKEFLNREDIIIVKVDAEYDDLVRRFKEDNEEYAEVQDIPKLLERYDEALGMCKNKIIRVKSPADREANVRAVMELIRKTT